MAAAASQGAVAATGEPAPAPAPADGATAMAGVEEKASGSAAAAAPASSTGAATPTAAAAGAADGATGGAATDEEQAAAKSAEAAGALEKQAQLARQRAEELREQEEIRRKAHAEATAELLETDKLQALIKEIDPDQMLDADVADLLKDIASEFIERVVSFSCQLAKHRDSAQLEARDVQLHLERNWDIHVPGTGRDEIRPSRFPKTNDAHKTRMSALTKEQTSKKKRND